jgi:hypothetical protein
MNIVTLLTGDTLEDYMIYETQLSKRFKHMSRDEFEMYVSDPVRKSLAREAFAIFIRGTDSAAIVDTLYEHRQPSMDGVDLDTLTRVVNFMRNNIDFTETILPERYSMPRHIVAICEDHYIAQTSTCPVCLIALAKGFIKIGKCGHPLCNTCFHSVGTCPVCRS